MARGQRKPIEEKIAKKEEIINALQIRIKSEKEELNCLYEEKRVKDLEILDNIIKSSGLSEYEITEVLQSYIRLKEQKVS